MALDCIIIDDSLFIRQTVSKLIEDAGHNVLAMYENGPSFLNTINEVNPDVIFCDIILPEMTGLDLLGIISEGFPNAKIIMLSGVTQSEAISAALRLGAIDFLQKPVNKDRLLLLLDKLSDSIIPPSVEKLSTIGVSCILLSGFLEELIAHSSSTLRKVVRQQTISILEHVKRQSKGMLVIDVERSLIEPDPMLWGNYTEKEVLEQLSSIPQELNYELQFLYSEDFVENLYDQAIMTMISKKRFAPLLEKIDVTRIGLPEIPTLTDPTMTHVSKAGTSYEELNQAISVAVFVFDKTGPEIVTRINPDLLSEADLMKNSIFYYTLVGDNTSFQEGLFGPLPVSSDKAHQSLSSLAYTMKKKSEVDQKERTLILSIYFGPEAEQIISDYNRLSFIIRTRLFNVNYVHEIDKSIIRGLVDDIIDYILED